MTLISWELPGTSDSPPFACSLLKSGWFQVFSCLHLPLCWATGKATVNEFLGDNTQPSVAKRNWRLSFVYLIQVSCGLPGMVTRFTRPSWVVLRAELNIL